MTRNGAVSDLTRGRHAGVLLPLFSAASTRSWGIGEIGDIPAMGRWLGRAGFDLWLMLPVNEMSPGHHSPYSAMTAMAIDSIYLTVDAVEDFAALGGEASLVRRIAICSPPSAGPRPSPTTTCDG